MVLSVGMVWSSHAATDLAHNNPHTDIKAAAYTQFSPSVVSQHIAESSSFDRFFSASHNGALERHNTDEELQRALYESSLDLDSLSQVEKNTKQHSSDGRHLDLGLTTSSRMAYFARTGSDEREPLYQLAIELPIEPAPSLVKGYRIDFAQSHDWTLQTPASSSRISGWKESNLIYTIYHHRLSFA
ncbi:hypothetical protein [Photobacterium minamisatsumaniensis]|uniref:hypothetical protein n=1 Tax=Photobacterium minamisatsumaniensis TaxID=2910233 RepID=UPI003D09E01E